MKRLLEKVDNRNFVQ